MRSSIDAAISSSIQHPERVNSHWVRNTHADVVIVGAGPAGIAAAIAASAKGLRSIVVDARTPPINKLCGEGLLPCGVAALRALGIQLNDDIAFPFLGIRFTDHDSSVCAKFANGSGFGLRRVRLHELLVDRAIATGVSFLWGTRVTNITPDDLLAGKNRIRYKWLVGADGQNSQVRKWAKLSFRSFTSKRFAFRRHFQIRPWSDFVEVHWGTNCQIVTTPTAAGEVCVTVFSRNSRLRIEQALPLFPTVAARLSHATATTKELGGVTSSTRSYAITRDRAALIGDASGTVDGVTGQGLSLSLQQALCLAEALDQGNLAHYNSAHRKLAALPATMARLMLLMDGNNWVRRRALRVFQNKPGLFTKLLSIHTGDLPVSSMGTREMADFGWNFLRAWVT